jgi:predicted RNase H-like HicB family nuclease
MGWTRNRPIPAHRRAPKLSDDRPAFLTSRIYEAAVRGLRRSAMSGHPPPIRPVIRSSPSGLACPPPRHWHAAYIRAMNKPYFVRAEWDAEAAVWVATSDDVPGLITEAETIEALDAKLKSMVPELLEANGCMPADGQVTVELLARRFSVALPAAA